MAKSSKSNNGLKDTRHEDVMRELRVQGRELRELRKTLKNILEIMQSEHVARMDAIGVVIAEGDATFPVYHRANPDYDGPQPEGYESPYPHPQVGDFKDGIDKREIVPAWARNEIPVVPEIPDVIIEDDFVDIRDMGVTC